MLTSSSCFYQSLSIGEFMKPAQVENHARGGFQGRGSGGYQQGGRFQGRGRGGYQRGALSRQATDGANGDRLPQRAESKERAANFDRRGGGRGGSTRGSSADPAVADVPIKEPAKPKDPAFVFADSKQFPVLPASLPSAAQPL